MRDFGVIHTRFWTWALESELSDNAKLIGAYVLTCQHSNSVGVFRIPFGYVSDDLGISSERVSEGFKELHECGFLEYCPKTRFVLIKKYLKWNPFQNQNQGKGALKILGQIPDYCTLMSKIAESLRQYCNEHIPEDELQALLDRFSNPSERVSKELRTKDQDQDQYQDQEIKHKCSDEHLSTAAPIDVPVSEKPAKKKIPNCPHDQICELWNEMMPEMPQVRKPGKTLKTQIGNRWREAKERQSLDWWRWYFNEIRGRPFLMGQVDGKPFRVDLEFATRPSKMEKVLNDGYLDYGPSTGSNLTDSNARTCQEFLNRRREQYAAQG